MSRPAKLLRERFEGDSAMHEAEHQLRRILRKGAKLRDFLPIDDDNRTLQEPLQVLAALSKNPEALLPKHPRARLMYEVFSMLLLLRGDGTFPIADEVDHDVQPYLGRFKPREYLRDLQEYDAVPAEELAATLREDLQSLPARIFTLAQLLVLGKKVAGTKQHYKIIHRLSERAPVREILFG